LQTTSGRSSPPTLRSLHSPRLQRLGNSQNINFDFILLLVVTLNIFKLMFDHKIFWLIIHFTCTPFFVQCNEYLFAKKKVEWVFSFLIRQSIV
jgi:hypothetical protein